VAEGPEGLRSGWMPNRVLLQRKLMEGVGCILRYRAEKFRESVGFGFKLNFFIFTEPTHFTSLLEML
jgi:hypothetical protein